MKILRLPNEITLKTGIVSGVLGGWLHVAVDSPLYRDIRPLFPIEANPVYGLVTYGTMSMICLVLYVPAIALYVFEARKYSKNIKKI
jgi:membrane-bound metal-dependent hydrolase YbcI (DUF457 family)